jgi:hypothetical protein
MAKTSKCCPLCEGEVSDSSYLFVKYVISDKGNIEDYFSGELTFESWKTMTLKALYDEKDDK